MPANLGKKGWVTSLTWMGSFPRAPPSRDGEAGAAQARVAVADSHGAVLDGRPAVLFTLDDGKVAVLSVKSGSVRYVFARPFLFWDCLWVEETGMVLLASSEGRLLGIHLDDATLAAGETSTPAGGDGP